MTEVRVKRGKEHFVSLNGHAGYNPGEDIVCAGVSALVGALINYIENNGHWKVKKVAPGDVELCFTGKMTDVALDMFTCGIGGIALGYPEHVRLTVE